MKKRSLTRRRFMYEGAVAAGAVVTLGSSGNFLAQAKDSEEVKKTRSYNKDMQYRRLGRTGMWVSAVCMGGHWKRVAAVIGHKVHDIRAPGPGPALEALRKNRYEVLSRCMEVGINYIDACTEHEVSVYGPALKGRRDKMYLGFAMWPKCPRNKKWCKADALLETLEKGMARAKVDYVDVWRLVASSPGRHSEADEQEFAKAFAKAKEQGKARFTGVSSHGRPWLQRLCEVCPEHFQVILFPYTASSKERPKGSLFDAIRKHDIGTFGIKPFGSGSLFNRAKDQEDKNRKARLAIRHVLANPAITAPIPGLASVEEVSNVAEAIKERRQLDAKERAELEKATRDMWATLPPEYQWLKDWEYV